MLRPSCPSHLRALMWLCGGLCLYAPAPYCLAPIPDRHLSREWPLTDFSRHTVPIGEVIAGGPPRDGIPAIDRPQFIPVPEAAQWVRPREPVVSVRIGDESRAYPLQILIFHEIVNDEIQGQSVVVTFCPLCHAAIAFLGRIGDRTYTFGTTGRLRHVDLVMYDRETESWWQQFTGEAIVGQMAGSRLTRVDAQIVAFEDFASANPGAKVLSRDTGFDRPYGRNPYAGYDSADEPMFSRDEYIDHRLPPMERVLGIRTSAEVRLYPYSVLDRLHVINDRVAEQDVVVVSKPGTLSAVDRARIADSRLVASATAFSRVIDGQTLSFAWHDGRILDSETGSDWTILGQAVAGPLVGRQLEPVDGGVHFAFAWLAFAPDAKVYRAGQK